MKLIGYGGELLNWTRYCAAVAMVAWLLFLKWTGFVPDSAPKIIVAGLVLILLLTVTGGKTVIEKLYRLLNELADKKLKNGD